MRRFSKLATMVLMATPFTISFLHSASQGAVGYGRSLNRFLQEPTSWHVHLHSVVGGESGILAALAFLLIFGGVLLWRHSN